MIVGGEFGGGYVSADAECDYESANSCYWRDERIVMK
jgi:hypothetical protein